MVDNFDITNSMNNLYENINRSYLLDGDRGVPVEKGLRLNNYTELINFRSDTNYPHEKSNQLDIATYQGCFGKENSQPSRLLEPIINCSSRENIEASRFNYAIDALIDNKMIDVSGIEVPNKYLRFIPNRGIQTTDTTLNIPTNPAIEKLVNDIINISVKPAETPNLLKYKASRQRLTRAELLNINSISPPVPVQPVKIVP
jgi:hypothetical protein